MHVYSIGGSIAPCLFYYTRQLQMCVIVTLIIIIVYSNFLNYCCLTSINLYVSWMPDNNKFIFNHLGKIRHCNAAVYGCFDCQKENEDC
jgi:hypothetical protein